MTYTECIELRKEYINLISKNITYSDDKQYEVKDILIVPPFEKLSSSRFIYFQNYDKTKDFDSAINKFRPRPDLEVKLYVLDIEENEHRILDIED